MERSILHVAFSAVLILPTTFAQASDPCSLTVDVVGSGDVSQETIGYVDEEMRVDISPDLDKVTLENSEIYVEYGPYVDGHSQFSIRKLLIKSAGDEDQVCPSSGCTRYNYLEADAGRGDLTDASVVFDGDDRKTVRLTWNRSGSPTDRIVHEVSIFPYGRFLKVDYLEARYQINIVDLGWPGGTGGGRHVAHGHEAWNADPGGGNGRGYITHQEPGFMGSYYNRYPADGVDDPDDGGNLNYHGHFTYGVYNPENNRGFARTVKVEDVSIFKLLLDPDSRRGLETFPYPFVLAGTPEFTGYFQVVTRGEEEILSTGMSLADGILPLELPPDPCGQAVRLTAVPDPGWEFAGWSGAVTGALNPASLVINDHLLVTATFTQPGHEFAEPDGEAEDDGSPDGGAVDDDAAGDLAGEDEGPPKDAGDRADQEPQDSFRGGCSCATNENSSLLFLLVIAALLALSRQPPSCYSPRPQRRRGRREVAMRSSILIGLTLSSLLLVTTGCSGGGVGGCQVGNACDDEDPCTLNDTCREGGACAGEPLRCEEPPPSTCKDEETLLVFASPGMCENGQCRYPQVEVACPQGCADDDCAGDPCAGVECNDPPPSECASAMMVRTFAPTGTCSQGVCVYPFDDSYCPHGCEDGSCRGDPQTDGGTDAGADPASDGGVDAGGDQGPVVLQYDVVVVGAGTGGVAAAIQAARLGVSVALIEETDWIGGQMTAAAVSTLDEGGFNDDAGIYIEFVNRVIDHYTPLGKNPEVCGIRGNWRGTEARVGQQILRDMIAAETNIDVYTRARVTQVLSVNASPHPVVTGVEIVRTTDNGVEDLRFESAVVVDATEYGDLLPLSPARYRVGNATSDAIEPDRCVQDITYTCVIRRYSGGAPSELRITSPPPGYTQAVENHFASIVSAGGNDWRNTPWGTYPVNWLTHVAYRSVPDSTNQETFGPEEYEKMSRTGVNWANDFDYTVGALQDRDVRRDVHCQAKLQTIMFLYYMQEILGETEWAIANDEGFDTPYTLEENLCANIPQELKDVERHFPVIPYVRESRRMIGLMTLTASDIKRQGSPPTGARRFTTSLAVGDYGVDLHDCNQDPELELSLESRADIPQPNRQGPFQIPFEVFIPEATDGLLAAEKNLSYTRLVNGASRLHPVTMHTGQAVGVLAALSVQRGVQPRTMDPVPVQWELLKAGARLGVIKYTDVPLSHAYWRDVELATVHGVFAGYPNGSFGVFESLTRAQAAVVLARLLDLPTDNPPPPTFEDVPASHWAYAAVEAVHTAGITSGCSENPPRFCPDDSLTRGQMAVFIVRGLGLNTADASTVSYYDDVPSGHSFFGYIQLATDLGLVEACDTGSDFYCPDDSSLRGEAARVAARTILHLHP